MEQLPIILVVEDDPIIQNLIDDALSDGGFDVDIASTGEEAVILLAAGKKAYRALVTDINLPGKLDGWEVSRRAREIDADCPIVYVSGDSGADWASKGVPNSIMLTKPFAPAQLVTAVSQLLNSGSPATSGNS